MSNTKAHLNPDLKDALSGLFGKRLSMAPAVREQHGRDESFHVAHAPDAVVFAHSTEEVVEIVNLCSRHETAIVAYGTGTSLEGQIAALKGGVCIDMSGMDAILQVSQDDLDCRVQAGVTRVQLNDHLHDMGLFFPIDPGANASLGGMTATRASGTNAVRYGTMRENVLGLTVVLADGRVIKTGGRARKSAAGYDLTRLMVGSEGTLGIITEVQLRLQGIPDAMSAAVCSFDDLEGAANTAMLVIQSGIPVARMELLDEVQMDAVNRYSKTDYPPRVTMFFEFHGTQNSVKEQAQQVGEITGEFGGGDFKWETRPEDRNRLWKARHNAYYAGLALRPGCKGWATDVCVPISRLAECILETRKDIDAAGLVVPIVGHVGDGNFHLVFLIDPDNEAEIAQAAAVNDRMVIRAIDMGGTCTGEHGIGYGKMGFLKHEHGEAVSVMRQIKLALDPKQMLNPGKVV